MSFFLCAVEEDVSALCNTREMAPTSVFRLPMLSFFIIIGLRFIHVTALSCSCYFWLLLHPQPTSQPSGSPSSKPSLRPSTVPSVAPSSSPSAMPSPFPSDTPSSFPTRFDDDGLDWPGYVGLGVSGVFVLAGGAILYNYYGRPYTKEPWPLDGTVANSGDYA